MTDRIQYDGDLDHLDEIVITGATVHIEQMNTHHWDIQITRNTAPTGGPTVSTAHLHLYGSDLGWVEQPTLGGMAEVARPAVPVCHEWMTRDGRRHECFMRHSPLATSAQHKCICGCGTLVKP